VSVTAGRSEARDRWGARKSDWEACAACLQSTPEQRSGSALKCAACGEVGSVLRPDPKIELVGDAEACQEFFVDLAGLNRLGGETLRALSGGDISPEFFEAVLYFEAEVARLFKAADEADGKGKTGF